MRKPNPVLGRKHCTRCSRWRPVSDFSCTGDYLKSGHPRLSSNCRTCQRVVARIRRGMERRGKPYEQQRRVATAGLPRLRGSSRPDHTTPEYHAYQRRRYAQMSPERREAQRERQRFQQEAQRRAAGQKPRNFTRPVPKGSTERLLVDARPFAEWLRERIPPSRADRALWLRQRQLDDSLAVKLLADEKPQVHIDTVDRVLVAHGSALWEVYPDLYDEAAA